jgi:hypothetical protein
MRGAASYDRGFAETHRRARHVRAKLDRGKKSLSRWERAWVRVPLASPPAGSQASCLRDRRERDAPATAAETAAVL